MFVLPVIPYPAINPILISIGPLAIRWYALAYIVGIIAGWFYARAIIQRAVVGRRAPFTVLDFDDFVVWITLGIILGGRIGYVLFYNLPHFATHPAEIFQIWNGGMSFHGGVAGCIVAVILFAWRRHIPTLSLGDVTCAVAPIGLFLGRIANFINGELWGRPTRCALGHDLPARRPVAAPSEPALRSLARRRRAVHRARLAGARRRIEAAGRRDRDLLHRLWIGAHRPANSFASRTCSLAFSGARDGSPWECCSAFR